MGEREGERYFCCLVATQPLLLSVLLSVCHIVYLLPCRCDFRLCTLLTCARVVSFSLSLSLPCRDACILLYSLVLLMFCLCSVSWTQVISCSVRALCQVTAQSRRRKRRRRSKGADKPAEAEALEILMECYLLRRFLAPRRLPASVCRQGARRCEQSAGGLFHQALR